VTFDPYEIGARNSDPELGALQPLPPAPKRMRPMPLLGLLLGIAAVLAIAQGSVGGAPPEVQGSCAEPAFALSTEQVDQFAVVRWSAAGPSGATVVLGVDVTSPPGPDALLGRRELVACGASGQFGLRVPPGEHTVTAFLVGTDGSVTTVGSRKVLVTEP
jgi:hypothetical protein